MNRTQCPPCSGNCRQGRDCPAEHHKQAMQDAVNAVADVLFAAAILFAFFGVGTACGWWRL